MTSFDRVCRFCLEEKSNLMSLFMDENLPSRIMTVSPSVKISPDDGLPSQICNKCLWLANSSFRFHMQCRVSQIALDNRTEGSHTDHASMVKQITTTNDLRSIRQVCATSNQMQNVTTQTEEEETKKHVSTMTDVDFMWPYGPEMHRQWCAYIQCKYMTKDNVFVKALNDVISKNSNINFPEIQGKRIYQLDMTVRILHNDSLNQRTSGIIPPVVDLTEDEEEKTVIFTKTSNNIVSETDNTDIRIAVLRKKSCLKRAENVDVSATSTKKVRFSEPPEENEQIIGDFKEQLAHCTTCKMLFQSNMDSVQFIEHLKEHGQQDIICMKCNQTLSNPIQKYTHIKICGQTDKKLPDPNKSQLNENEYTCNNGLENEMEKQVNSLQICEFCDKTFSEACHLLDHIRLHFPYNIQEDSGDYDL